MLLEENNGQLSSQALQHIETWLEKTLTESLELETSPEEKKQQELLAQFNRATHKTLTAIEKSRIDRHSLKELGLVDRKQQDQIYRSFFVYCHGIHDFIRTYTKSPASSPYSSSSELSQILWGTFFKLFQFYDPSMRILYQQQLEENENRSKRSFVVDVEKKLKTHQSINEELLYHLKQTEIAKSSSNYQNQLESIFQTSRIQQHENRIRLLEQEIDILQRENNHLTSFKQTALKTMEVSKNALSELIQRDNLLTYQVTYLTEQKSIVDNLYEELKVKANQLEKELNASREFIYSQKQSLTAVQDELNQSQERNMNLESLLQQLKAQLASARDQIKDYQINEGQVIHFLRQNQENLSQSFQFMSFFNQSSHYWEKYYHWIHAFRDQQYLYSDEDGSSPHSLQQIHDLFTALLTHHPLVMMQNTATIDNTLPPPSSASAVLTELLLSQQIQLQNMTKEMTTVKNENFHVTSDLTSCLILLNDLFQDLHHFTNKIHSYQKIETRFAATREIGEVLQTLSDRLEKKNSIIHAEKRLAEQRADKQERITQQLLQEKEELLIIQDKYEKLEPMFLQLVDHFKQVTSEKKMLESSVASLEDEQKILREKEFRLHILERRLVDVESDLKDREAHIVYLKEDLQKRVKEQNQQQTSSSVYENLVPCFHQVLHTTKTMMSVFESHRRQGKKVYNSGEGKNQITDILLLSNYRDVITSNKDHILFDDQVQLTPQEVNRLVEILDSLLALPKSLNDVIIFSDSVYDMKEEVERCKAEVDIVKSYSAKERRRISQQYEEQIQQMKDVMATVSVAGSFINVREEGKE